MTFPQVWEVLARFCAGTDTRRFIFRAMVLALAVRIAIIGAAWLTAYIVVGSEGKGFGDTMLEMLKRWDATQFERIAEHGYPTSGDYQELIVFPPLYPYTVRAVEFLIPSFLVAGLLVSALASVAAGYFIQAIVRLDGGDDAEASRSLWYFFVFPTAYFLVMPYTEALFMALLLGSFYFARKNRWWWAGVLGALCTASRLTGIVLIPALMVEALHQKKWRPLELEPQQLASFVLAPLGFLFYLWLNYHLHGNFFAFLDYEDKNWFHHRIWPWESIREAWLWLKSSPGFLRTSIYEMRLAGSAVVALLLIIGVRWLRPSYQVFGWLALLMFLSVSYQISLPRYALTVFPMYFVLARLGRNLEVHQALLTVSTLMMGTLYVIYAYRWGF
jgi:Mannosyltransferase (PIG-V)